MAGVGEGEGATVNDAFFTKNPNLQKNFFLRGRGWGLGRRGARESELLLLKSKSKIFFVGVGGEVLVGEADWSKYMFLLRIKIF